MISFLRGTVASKNESQVIVDVGGVGFSVNMAPSAIARIGAVGESVTVNTHFQMRDEQPELFGFLSTEEINYFNKLISISGIGPKAALAILGTLTVSDLALAIIASDVKAITRAPGVGTKMAQRIILELKEKIDTEDAVMPVGQSAPKLSLRADTEAVNALIALGASASEAQKAVMQVAEDGKSTEDIIKEALRRMSNGIL